MKGNVAGQGVVRGFQEEVTSEDEKVSRPCKDLGALARRSQHGHKPGTHQEGQEGPVWLQHVRGKGRK